MLWWMENEKLCLKSIFSSFCVCVCMSELSLCVCLCKKRVENFPSFQTTRGGEREKVKAAADEHTQKPPTISKEPEESYDADRKAGRNGFLFFFGPQLSSPSFAYMIINLLLFLTFCQQQHHHHRSQSPKSFALSACPHTQCFDSSQGKLLNFEYIFPSDWKIFLLCFGAGCFCLSRKKFPSCSFCAPIRQSSYDYKVYDVRKLPNHIALDSTCDRTQAKNQGKQFFSGKISFCE